MTIAIQGIRGSFHHLAAQHFYGDGHKYISRDSFVDVFRGLTDGKADAAIVAIENSMYGSITEVYDLLQTHDFRIIGEVVEHIQQNLIGFAGTPLDTIKRVYSHPVALAQCAEYLSRALPLAEIIEYHDTAAAVAAIKKSGDKAAAAIAGTTAAELYDMTVLQPSIHDEPQNYTRFVVIAPTSDIPPSANKASLILTTSHQPGALYNALGIFAKSRINLTKLQSRPIPGKVWQYKFYVDVTINPQALEVAKRELEARNCTVHVLGQYKAAANIYED